MNVVTQHTSETLGYSRGGGPSGTVSASWMRWEDVDASFIDRWRCLFQTCGMGTPFLSPDFVVPAVRRLSGLVPPMIFVCEQGDMLLGLGLFCSLGSSVRMPLRHLRAWQTPHTYCDGLLIRRDQGETVLKSFWEDLTVQGWWHAVEFPRFPLNENDAAIWVSTAEQFGVRSYLGTPWTRAALHIEHQPESRMLQSVSLQRARSLRRGWKSLEKFGEVRFEVVRDMTRIPRCLEDMLRLENLGWKGECWTSLASQESDSRFFREMVLGMADGGDVAFSRLLVGERPVASVVHLTAGDVVYAFKLGWDPEFERGCPGFQIKAQMAAHAGTEFPEARMIDSCAGSGSFIERVWPDRRALALKMFAVSSLGKASAGVLGGLRCLKRNAHRLASGWWPR